MEKGYWQKVLDSFVTGTPLMQGGALLHEKLTTPKSGFADIRGSATPGSPIPAGAVGGGNAGASTQPALGEKGYAALQEQWREPSKTAAPAAGGQQSVDPAKTVTNPYPTTLDEAYKAFRHDYTGGGYDPEKIEKFLGDKGKARFNLGEQDASEIAFRPDVKGDFGVPINLENMPDMEKAFAITDKNQGAAFPTDTGGFESNVRSKGRGTMAALRERDAADGLLFASGKYWSEGADGKLQAIEAPQGSRTTLSRDEALEIAKSRRTAGDVEINQPAETSKSTLTGGVEVGGSPLTSDAKPGPAKDQAFETEGTPEGLTSREYMSVLQNDISNARAKGTFAANQIKEIDEGWKLPAGLF